MGRKELFQTLFKLSLASFLGFAAANPPLQLTSQVGGFSEKLIRTNELISPRNRLPTDIIPSSYQLEIIPILDASFGAENLFKAPGTVIIHVKCNSSTQTVTLHSKEIEFEEKDVTIEKADGNPDNPSVTACTFHPELETVDIELNERLEQNAEYVITIKFTARVNDELDGLYRSTYIDSNGQERIIATTQFEKTGARRAFPCYDEPSFRATFDIKIGHSPNYHCLSNGELVSANETLPDFPEWLFDTFKQTPIMPTYLVAIIVSDFVEQKAPEGLFRLPVSTWGPSNQMVDGSGEFSAQVAAKLLSFYEKYFGHDYQMTKLDSIAIPDFAAGAMENWGLNTYRVPYMLFFDGDSTQFEQWRQAAVIAHEVTHSWFGNQVTNRWWNDLWIKEGFARYFQFLGVEDAEPQLESMHRVVLDVIQLAMQNDFGPNSHPIRGNWTETIEYQNSRIIYEKGASLIRMMQAFLTEPTLQKGLTNYLTKNAYGTATQDDVFSELQAQALVDGIELPNGLTVKDIMDTWTLQSGYPVIKVSKAGSKRIFLSQEKFLPIGEQRIDGEELWEIPINIATQENPDFGENNFRPVTWIHKSEALISLDIDNTEQWIVVNPDVRNYYRVLYDEYYRIHLKEQLESDHNVISRSSRSQLFDDYYTLVEHGYTTIDKAMDFTIYLEKEDTLTVWTTVLLHWKKLYTYLGDTDAKSAFETFATSKIVPQLEKLGGNQLPTDPPIRSMLRAQLLDWGCAVAGSEICYNAAEELMRTWMDDDTNNPIMADIQATIFCAAYAKGDETLRDFVRKQYENAEVSVRQQGLLLNAMACSLTEEEQSAKLESLLDEENMSIPDRRTLLQKIAETSSGRNLIIPFLKANKARVMELLGESSFSSPISALANYFASQERLQEVTQFFNENPDFSQATKDSILQSISKIEANMKWINSHFEVLKSWLVDNLAL